MFVTMRKFLLVVLLCWLGIEYSPNFASNNAENEIIENTQAIAFPGAEGYGRFATGGRGGRIIYVTNLNDSGEGSFRDAVMQTGPRIVMFKVSGTIELQSHVNLGANQSNLTIAGQTAPGDGITLRNYRMYIGADNVIIRFMRFRMGDEKGVEDDSLWGRRKQTIIIDHCTMSWATDETSSFYDNVNFTMQWCILSESLRNSVHLKGSHGYMGIWGGRNASFHHNLMAHHDSRLPRFCGSRYSNLADLEHVDFRNNVIYNWGSNSGYAGEGGTYNMVNNYYKSGPGTRSNPGRIFQMYQDDGKNSQPAGIHGVFYSFGNYVNNFPDVTADNWVGMHRTFVADWNDLRSVIEYDKGQITTHTAIDAFEQVLEWAGASLKRDPVDSRIVQETRDGDYTYEGSNGSTGGLIDSQADVGGWPLLESLAPELDSDGDGMPDWWELEYGLDPNDAEDGNNYDLHSYYTNVEVYLNSLVQHIVDEKLLKGSANYADIYEVYSGAPELFSTDEVSQTVEAGEAFETIVFNWDKAVSVRVNGLPDGVVAEVDEDDKKVTISGTSILSGVFDYDITTIGGITVVTESGSLTITGGSALECDNPDLLAQSILTNSQIDAVGFTFANADNIIAVDFPDGIDLAVNDEEGTALVGGSIAEAGRYEFKVQTDGAITISEQNMIINVFDGNAEIIKHGSPSSSQTIDLGEAIGEFYFRWENAVDVEIEGLPNGVVVIKNYNKRHAILRGRPLEAGVFNYTIRTVGGVNEAEFVASFTVTETTNIIDNSRDYNNVTVSPNPFIDELNIVAKTDEQINWISLYSLDGNLIYKEKGIGNQHQINIGNVNSGMYFIVIEFENSAPQTFKVVKR